jgi:hypothetical protein
MSENQKMLVFSNAAEGRDDEYNEWYDTVHIPDVLTVPGVVSATRYDAVGLEPSQPAHRYLTVYEIEGSGVEVVGEIGRRAMAEEMEMSDSVDSASALITVWTPHR